MQGHLTLRTERESKKERGERKKNVEKRKEGKYGSSPLCSLPETNTSIIPAS
jgi:hypothetical protein